VSLRGSGVVLPGSRYAAARLLDQHGSAAARLRDQHGRPLRGCFSRRRARPMLIE